jgi:pimeloyl-ACP methyl ester carboxylesterase
VPSSIGVRQAKPGAAVPILSLDPIAIRPDDASIHCCAMQVWILEGFRSEAVLDANLILYAPDAYRTPTLAAPPFAFRNGQPSAVALDIVALMDALKIQKATLAGFDWGARTANIIAALWPERCKAMVSVSGYLIGSQEAGKMPLPPKAEFEWWYQFYFATERGREGYDKYRRDFSKLIWHLASPKWNFDDATFDRSAKSFENPDHVAIVIHNYRWRQALAEGEPKYDDLEKRLAAGPVITVPTITMEGDANGRAAPGS